MAQLLSGEEFVKSRGCGGEGKRNPLDLLPAASQSRAFSKDMIQSVPQVDGRFGGDDFEFGVKQFDESKLMHVLSFFDVWFNDCGPRLIGKKPLDSSLKVIDMALCAPNQ